MRAAALCVLLAALPAAATDPAPEDPYRHLEDAGDPRTQEFFREEGARARAVLDAIPGRGELLARIRALSASGSAVTHVRATPTRVFYLRAAAPGAGATLFVREGASGGERVLVDPSRYDRDGLRAAIDWLAPSPDGRHVAFGVSLGGAGDCVLRVIQVDGARVLPPEIDRACFNEGLAWHPDGRSFFYARVPDGNPPARRFANVRMYRHVLGRETGRDEVVLAPGVGGARDIPEFVQPALHVPADSRHAYAIVRDGVRREIAVHATPLADLAAARPRWQKVAGHEDEVLAIEAWRDDLYLLSKRNAPRHRLLRLKPGAPISSARPVVPQGEAVIQGFGLARDAIYLHTNVGGLDRLERVPLGLLGTKAPEYVRTPFDTAISQLVTHPRIAGALLRMQGWIEPPAVVHVEPGSGNLRRTPIQPAPEVDFSAMDEVRLYAPSHDGTRIPVTLVYRRTTRLDGMNPTLVTAYGSYGAPLSPTFDPARLAWLERGGVLAVAHVRGGGEYGEDWHRAGRGTAKVNAVLDTIAVCDFLVGYGFTNPKRLALHGAGAGGIPAGGALVRRPDLFAAVVARSAVLDMLRFERLASGPANVPEFGSAATPEGRQALHAISPYHGVADGVAYPAVLLTASLADTAVEAWQPAKMLARLAAATRSGKPVLLRLEGSGNVASGGDPRAEELADIYAFLFWQMGDPRFQPPVAAPPAPPERGDE